DPGEVPAVTTRQGPVEAAGYGEGLRHGLTIPRPVKRAHPGREACLSCTRLVPIAGDRISRRSESTCKSRTPRPGFEPGAYSLGGSRSIQLSYRGRMPDPAPRLGLALRRNLAALPA